MGRCRDGEEAVDVAPEQGMGEFVPWLRISLFKAKGCLMTAGNIDSPFTAAAVYLKV